MSKTIKVIDLLNKIANDENYRPTVTYRGVTYISDGTYYTNSRNNRFGILQGWEINLILNDEVEIIEEQEEIDIQSIKELEPLEDYEVDNTDVRLNRELINKILQWAKQLDKKIKEK